MPKHNNRVVTINNLLDLAKANAEIHALQIERRQLLKDESRLYSFVISVIFELSLIRLWLPYINTKIRFAQITNYAKNDGMDYQAVGKTIYEKAAEIDQFPERFSQEHIHQVRKNFLMKMIGLLDCSQIARNLVVDSQSTLTDLVKNAEILSNECEKSIQAWQDLLEPFTHLMTYDQLIIFLTLDTYLIGPFFQFCIANPVVNYFYFYAKKNVLDNPIQAKDMLTAQAVITRLKEMNAESKNIKKKHIRLARFITFWTLPSLILMFLMIGFSPELLSLAIGLVILSLGNIYVESKKQWQSLELKLILNHRVKTFKKLIPSYLPINVSPIEKAFWEASLLEVTVHSNYEKISNTILAQLIKNILIKAGIKVSGYAYNHFAVAATFNYTLDTDKIYKQITNKINEYKRMKKLKEQFNNLSSAMKINGYAKPETVKQQKFLKYFLTIPSHYSNLVTAEKLGELFPGCTIQVIQNIHVITAPQPAVESAFNPWVEQIKKSYQPYFQVMEEAKENEGVIKNIPQGQSMESSDSQTNPSTSQKKEIEAEEITSWENISPDIPSISSDDVRIKVISGNGFPSHIAYSLFNLTMDDFPNKQMHRQASNAQDKIAAEKNDIGIRFTSEEEAMTFNGLSFFAKAKIKLKGKVNGKYRVMAEEHVASNGKILLEFKSVIQTHK